MGRSYFTPARGVDSQMWTCGRGWGVRSGAQLRCSMLALAGCGGDDEADAPVRPKLPAELAAALAYESDQISASLAAGRECAGAPIKRRRCEPTSATRSAAARSRPPSAAEMNAAATSLDDGIVCEPAPPPAPEPKPEAQGGHPVSPTDPCAQLEAQVEQAKEQEKATHGPDKEAAKDVREQLGGTVQVPV